jgi:hypothetical protein
MSNGLLHDEMVCSSGEHARYTTAGTAASTLCVMSHVEATLHIGSPCLDAYLISTQYLVLPNRLSQQHTGHNTSDLALAVRPLTLVCVCSHSVLLPPVPHPHPDVLPPPVLPSSHQTRRTISPASATSRSA